MRVAITGAGGQVGEYLSCRLASSPQRHEVIAICRNFLAAKKLAARGCAVRVGSLLNPDETAKLVDGCDAVIHCAHDWAGSARRDSSNAAMIRNLSNTASVKLLIYLSSVVTYSTCIETGVNTYEDPRPDTDYGKTKLGCEAAAAREFSANGRRAIVLRLGHVYGPYFYWSGRILDLLRGLRFRLPFGGRLDSNSIRIDRVGDAVIQLLNDVPQGGIYNLTNDPQLTWKDVFSWHSEICGLESIAPLQDDESFRIRQRYLQSKLGEFRKIRRELFQGLRAAAVQLIYPNPALKRLGSAMLAKAPGWIDRAITRNYKQAVVAREIHPAQGDSFWEPWLAMFFSDPAPGRYLRLPSVESIDPDREPRMREELFQSFKRWSLPDGILQA